MVVLVGGVKTERQDAASTFTAGVLGSLRVK
jgi:hypothetical protein